MPDYDLLIVGGGAAGMAAALAAEKAGLRRILLVDRGPVPGGILTQCIHSGFGLGYFGEELTGPEYAGRFARQLERSHIELLLDTTVLSIAEDRTAVISGAVCGYRKISFRWLILAAGCRETPIGALTVAGTRPAGIFTAGQAQALVNLRRYDIGSEIIILGSGDIGLIMARRFTLLGKHIIAVVEQKAACGGMPRNVKSCIEVYDIPVITSATVTEVHGKGRVSGVTVRYLESGREELIACDTLVTAVGLTPERELLKVFGGEIPEWVSLCGNCDYVHEIVDAVTFQAERLGADAAKALLKEAET